MLLIQRKTSNGMAAVQAGETMKINKPGPDTFSEE